MKLVTQLWLALLVLLTQVAPLQARSAPPPHRCAMACCAWLAEEDMADCGCAAVPAGESRSHGQHLPPAAPEPTQVQKPMIREGDAVLPSLVASRWLSEAVRLHGAPVACGISAAGVRMTVLLCRLLT